MQRYSPRSSNSSEVGLRDPRVPMVLEDTGGVVPVLVLTKSIFIGDSRVSRVVEKRGGDPGLGRDTMSVKVGVTLV